LDVEGGNQETSNKKSSINESTENETVSYTNLIQPKGLNLNAKNSKTLESANSMISESVIVDSEKVD